MSELSPKALKAIATVEKLMRLAGKNPNEAEAAAASAKAMDLLAKYNLDMSIVEQNSGDKGKREDAKMAGGLYHYQRDLWQALAELNFCMYWNQYRYDKDKSEKRRRPSYTFQHRLVGRTVNVTATRTMAQYLEQTIERLTRERMGGDGKQFFTRYAISYREGIAARVEEKIYERRRHLLAEERAKEKAAEKAARAAGREGVSTSTALTLASLRQSEEDANNDFLYGEGWSAKQRAEALARAEASRIAEEEYTRWAKANPEEAAKEAEELRKRQRAYRPSYGRASYRDTKQRDDGAYYSGYDAGANVSIDPQADGRKNGGLLK